MRAFGWMMAYAIVGNLTSGIVSALTGWDFWHVLACLYAGLIGWLCCEVYA